jgi:hypothetical protein
VTSVARGRGSRKARLGELMKGFGAARTQEGFLGSAGKRNMIPLRNLGSLGPTLVSKRPFLVRTLGQSHVMEVTRVTDSYCAREGALTQSCLKGRL